MGGSAVVIVIILYNGSSPREHQQIQTWKMEKAEEGRELEGDGAFRMEEKGFQEELKRDEGGGCCWNHGGLNLNDPRASGSSKHQTQNGFLPFWWHQTEQGGLMWYLGTAESSSQVFISCFFFFRWALFCSSVARALCRLTFGARPSRELPGPRRAKPE